MTKLLSNTLLILILIGCTQKENAGKKDKNEDFDDVQTPVIKDEPKDHSIEALVQEYEDPGRVDWQNPDLVIDKLGDLDDKVIADIGAGSGYFTFRLVNRASKVLAIDIEEQFLEFIEERKSGLNDEIGRRVETRLVSPDDPNLEESEVDIVLLVNTYLNIDPRTPYLKKLRKGLKPNGKVVIVDFKTGDIPTGPPDELKVSTAMAKSELTMAGFEQISLDTISLRYQYIIIAQ
ncbi:class I SAM-dependent methyltransferase [Fulvivirgaceae bacterium BMA12]|uniref:Class I SAM-dependent methyltransferase n=1 Tax=Agaribacillus aureus TaxID=3051825 RepID=A0ABT8LEH1_9BACT|nr:class I SAM-dependent methyltransferase [Fulvivirgaceae bacterium BMA12]